MTYSDDTGTMFQYTITWKIITKCLETGVKSLQPVYYWEADDTTKPYLYQQQIRARVEMQTL